MARCDLGVVFFLGGTGQIKVATFGKDGADNCTCFDSLWVVEGELEFLEG